MPAPAGGGFFGWNSPGYVAEYVVEHLAESRGLHAHIIGIVASAFRQK